MTDAPTPADPHDCALTPYGDDLGVTYGDLRNVFDLAVLTEDRTPAEQASLDRVGRLLDRVIGDTPRPKCGPECGGEVLPLKASRIIDAAMPLFAGPDPGPSRFAGRVIERDPADARIDLAAWLNTSPREVPATPQLVVVADPTDEDALTIIADPAPSPDDLYAQAAVFAANARAELIAPGVRVWVAVP